MQSIQHDRRKVVLGLGNILLGDEGFGIHALQYAQSQLGAQFPVEWVDGGVLGLGLLPLVEECSHLLVLDAVDAGLQPGTLANLGGEQIPLYAGMKLSEHQVGFQEVLALAALRGNFPSHLHLVGVQPANLAPGMELSPAVKVALPAVAQRTRDILQSWLGQESYRGI